jgi:TonB family protein
MILYFEFEDRKVTANVTWPKNDDPIVVNLTDKRMAREFPTDLYFEVGVANNVEFIIKTNSLCCGQAPDKMYPKPLSFPKPPFPAAARAVRATGEVVVAIKIDKEGKVNFAKAESGHPLLQRAAEAAARQSLFETAENNDEREAKLTYVFLSDGEKNLKRYSNPYRIEVTAHYEVILSTPSH